MMKSIFFLFLLSTGANAAITRQECTDQGGTVVGSAGDGAIFEPGYMCEATSAAPTDTVVDEPIATDGEVCCGGTGSGIDPPPMGEGGLPGDGPEGMPGDVPPPEGDGPPPPPEEEELPVVTDGDMPPPPPVNGTDDMPPPPHLNNNETKPHPPPPPGHNDTMEEGGDAMQSTSGAMTQRLGEMAALVIGALCLTI
ncbi:expressed unknown protein [Seminavis robusta]|uniref:Uncharacterized protein n=1 Tax=Seminavis robusta TaxID=568900 RepID=A0A9N8HGV9_9STRA|nr:expressed unknown protein [Seminavis robusta]|eukprot:Sro599_g173280.1 n/a (196) ;mRNA; f:37183-37770